MKTGLVIDGRFELERLAGAGGMGVVYRALDRLTGEFVALKMLGPHGGVELARFQREAELLNALRHPGIVRHIAHGLTDTGDAYLAMEWLEGEDLSACLTRGPLGELETMTLARRVAAALAFAHSRGVVHRDLKPANIFLPMGNVAQATLLDFGIARRLSTQNRTGTGHILGTPGYMAPEQARGEGLIDARADVFALGCVLFECIVGRPVFCGDHALAILAKILFEEVPRIREFAPTVKWEFDALIASMLVKDLAMRPEDGAAVVRALERTDTRISESEGKGLAPTPVSAVLTDGEKRLLSLVVAMPMVRAEIQAHHDTIPAWPGNDRRLAVENAAGFLKARVDELANGALLLSIVGERHPTDQAARAARCALRLCAILPDAAIALATGRAEARGKLPVGEIVDRVAALLDQATKNQAEQPGCIVVDEATQSLFDLRFEVVSAGTGVYRLLGERAVEEEGRTLLGKPMPFLGRDRELRMVRDLIEDSFEERRSRAILVTGAAGIGKSRLRQEIVTQMRAARQEMAFSFGRGDAVGAGSAFSLLGSTFRRSLQIGAGEPVAFGQRKLLALAERYLPGADGTRVAEFLGEMLELQFPAQDSPRLQAARLDVTIMADQIRQAYLDLMGNLVRARPTLMVLEDLHWGDDASIKLLNAMLATLEMEPVVVLAFARPEVHDRFPKLWAGRDAQEVRLMGLGNRAAEALVRAALGDTVAPAEVQRMVERAGGNAFFLEELIRAVSQGHGASLPETVLGMVEARLASLDPDSRRILRAASVFGDFFWESSIIALIGSDTGMRHVHALLRGLVERELILERKETRFAHEREYAFRHAIVREACYAMLTDGDRVLGHRLAGNWLEKMGEPNHLVLAGHFDKGGDELRAALSHLRAAEQALFGDEPHLAADHAQRGMVVGIEGEVAASLHAIKAEAHARCGEYALALGEANEALRLVTCGSRSHCRALDAKLASAIMLRQQDAVVEALDLLLSIDPAPEAIPALAQCFRWAVSFLVITGRHEAASGCLLRMDIVINRLPQVDPWTLAAVTQARGHWHRYVERDPWTTLELDRIALANYELAGDRQGTLSMVSHVGTDLFRLGALEEADEMLVRAQRLSREGTNPAIFGWVYLALVRMEQHRLEDAHRLVAEGLRMASVHGNALLQDLALMAHASVDLACGHWERAATILVAGPIPSGPIYRLWHMALLAQFHLNQDRAAEALQVATEGLEFSKSLGLRAPEHESLLLVHAEALAATGNMRQAHAAIHAARESLRARAYKIPDLILRQRFLEGIKAHARTNQLAREWLGE